MRELNEILNYKAFMSFLLARTQETVPLSRSLIREVHSNSPFPQRQRSRSRALMVYSCFLADMTPIVIPAERRKAYINDPNTDDLQGFASFAEELQAEERGRTEAFT